ncbi:multiple sugar transport system substrate-binding protein [Butyrivibrio fibrisolvens DSM 3071]|uniref:Multiple sugar transport system substrate-binding protein n=1 Tax=Butyrivibrio fibrisolvens DSM 3071 TaxID=1121131 RepID=A0A1M5Z3V3_BUTFI|nr:ABC transporter substrate-binding protein [Butyrivibrio fibrisolvens]SHI18563.1 multiple sugar transport system substrate-binding protein [Butyrivibrio fibrisolvens DSM 3071]
MKKKIVATLLTAVMAASALAGCAQKVDPNADTAASKEANEESTQEENKEEAKEEKTEDAAPVEKTIESCEIEFWHGMSNTQEEVLTQLTDEFNSSNEYGITVTLVNQGSYGDLSQKLQAAAAADGLPDMAQAYNNWLNPYIDKVVDLTDFVENDFDNYDDIIEAYRNECSEFGFIHALPFNKSTYVMFYNKTVLDELGVEAPKTWEDLTTIGEAYVEKYGNPAWGVDDLAGFVEASLRQNGESYVDGTGALFDTDGGLETMTYIMDLYNNGYARLVGEDKYFSNVLSAQAMLGYIGSSTGASYITADGWELGVCPVPSNKESAAYCAGTNLVMFTQDANKQLAAFEYMKFLTSAESTTTWAIGTGYLPVRTSAYESAEYQEFMAGDVTATAAYEQSDAFFTSLAAYDASNDVRTAVAAKMEELILDETEPQDALDALVEEINAQF